MGSSAENLLVGGGMLFKDPSTQQIPGEMPAPPVIEDKKAKIRIKIPIKPKAVVERKSLERVESKPQLLESPPLQGLVEPQIVNMKEKPVDIKSTAKLLRDNNTASTHERTYCNSSVQQHRQHLGTVFSFKSQIMMQSELPQFPMKPLDAVRYYGNLLTEFEKTEILEYPEIYFIGTTQAQKI